MAGARPPGTGWADEVLVAHNTPDSARSPVPAAGSPGTAQGRENTPSSSAGLNSKLLVATTRRTFPSAFRLTRRPTKV